MGLDNVIIGCISKDRLAIEYTQKVVDYLNLRYDAAIPDVEEAFSAGKFSGGEPDTHFRVPLEGKNVYLFGIPNVASSISHLLSPEAIVSRLYFASQTAYENNASSVNVVCPDLPFSRADKIYTDFPKDSSAYEKNKGRGRLAKSVAGMFALGGVHNLLTLEVHSDLVKSFYDEVGITIADISPMPVIAHYLARESPLDFGENGERLLLVCPDRGATDRVDELSSYLRGAYGMEDASTLYLEKIRKVPNNPDEVEIRVRGTSDNYSEMRGKYAVIVDDIVDTAGTFSTACRQIKSKGIEHGTNGRDYPDGISGILVHPVLAGENYESPMKKLASSNVDELAFFNTRPFIEDNLIYPLKQISSVIRTAYTFAEGIKALEDGDDPERIFYTGETLDPQKVERVFNLKRSSSFSLS